MSFEVTAIESVADNFGSRKSLVIGHIPCFDLMNRVVVYSQRNVSAKTPYTLVCYGQLCDKNVENNVTLTVPIPYDLLHKIIGF